MKYALADLLRIRALREQAAAREVTKRRAAVAEAERELASRREELAEYKKWRKLEEERLVAEVIGQEVTLQDLADLDFKLNRLGEREAALVERIAEAEKHVEEAEAELRRGVEEHQVKTREWNKIDEHRQVWLSEESKLAEAAADKELEEFAVKTPDDEAEGVEDGYDLEYEFASGE